MIKRLYLVNGNLTQPLDKNDENIAVDSVTATQLATLNIGDWCYLTLLEGYKLEIIKITKFPSWYWVDRAQNNTCQFSFSIKAKIVYRLTSQEIEDAVDAAPLSIYPDGYGALEVSTGLNSWQINYQAINIEALGGISWMNPDGYEVVITDNNGMFGCCDGSLTGAPFAGGIFFYLTSELYAVLNVEGYIGINKSNKADIPPLSMGTPGWWLLTQPLIQQEWVNNPIQVNDWNLYGGSETFSFSDMYVANNMSVLDWNKFGGAKSFSNMEPKYISMDAYVLDMELFGSSVVYNNGLDMYISPTIKLLNWTLG